MCNSNMNDIERLDFWNREEEAFITKINNEMRDIIMRWDSCANKVPFIYSDDVAVKKSLIKDYPTDSLLSS